MDCETCGGSAVGFLFVFFNLEGCLGYVLMAFVRGKMQKARIFSGKGRKNRPFWTSETKRCCILQYNIVSSIDRSRKNEIRKKVIICVHNFSRFFHIKKYTLRD